MEEFDDTAQPRVPPAALPLPDALPLPTAALLEAQAAVAAVAAARTSTLTPGEHRRAVEAAYALLSTAHATALHLVRTLDDRPDAVPGAPTGRTAQWFLTERVRLARGQAAADVAAAWALDPDGAGFTPGDSPLAKAAAVDPTLGPRTVAGAPVGPLPMLGQALANGLVHRAHVDVAVRTLHRVPGAALRHRVTSVDDPDVRVGAVDAFLTSVSSHGSAQSVDRVAAHLLEALGVNPKDPDPHDQYERRHVTWHTDRSGMFHLRAQLAPAEGLVVKAAIESCMTDGTTTEPVTTEPVTTEPVTTEPVTTERRTLGQRRADAVVVWAHAVAHPPCSCAQPAGPTGTALLRPTAKIHLVVTPAQLVAAVRSHPATPHVDDGPARRDGTPPHRSPADDAAGYAVDGWGDPVGHGVLARLLCGAELQAVTLGEGRRVLDLGRTVRLATPRQRAALIARDRGCVMPGCPAPLSRCEAHHVTWWRHGGTTDLDNLALLCPAHHTAVHTGAWTLQLRDGVPWITPPQWIDPTRTPRRNTVFDTEDAARRLGARLRGRPDNEGGTGDGSRPP